MSETRHVLRADARRNRTLLLAAAAAEFADKGMGASVSDITARAGVGKGTLFRHFPTKDDLFAEVIFVRFEVLEEYGRRLLASEDAGEALLSFLIAVGRQHQEDDVQFLLRASMSTPSLALLRDRVFETVAELVRRAQETGAVRADITGADVVHLMCAPGHVARNVPDASPHLWRRYLHLIFDGLRADGAHPLKAPSTDDAEKAVANRPR